MNKSILKTLVVEALESYVPVTKAEIEANLTEPPNPSMGDLALPCFFMSKTLRKAPNAIASEISASFTHPFISVTPVNGFLNFSFQRDTAGEMVLETVSDESFGISEKNGKRVLIDFSSPNIAKPFSIGHLRSTMIGNSLSRIYEQKGYEVVSVNHLGDWGTQFGKMIVAIKKWGNMDEIRKNPMKSFFDLYVRFGQEADKEKEEHGISKLETEARGWFLKLEQGNEEAHELWKFLVEESLIEYKKMYGSLGVKFDHYLGESFYEDKMGAVIEELEAKGLLVESKSEKGKGMKIVELDDMGISDPCLILRSDGATLYETRDLTAAIYRHNAFEADEMLYVVGSEQELHFKKVFATLKKMGYEWAEKCQHIAFGLMLLEGEKMSTRTGKVVFLEAVLEKALDRSLQIINEKNPMLPNKEEVAKAVGYGAIVFNDLKNGRMNTANFSMEQALDFNGETGPYIQYTFARTQSVLKKGEYTEAPTSFDEATLSKDVVWELLKELQKFPLEIEFAWKKNEPSVLARYLLDLAKKYSRFYHDERILVDDEVEKQTKLFITSLVGKVIQKGLYLLGMEAPEQI